MSGDRETERGGASPAALFVGLGRARFGFGVAASGINAATRKALGERAVSPGEGGARPNVMKGMSREATQGLGGRKSGGLRGGRAGGAGSHVRRFVEDLKSTPPWLMSASSGCLLALPPGDGSIGSPSRRIRGPRILWCPICTNLLGLTVRRVRNLDLPDKWKCVILTWASGYNSAFRKIRVADVTLTSGARARNQAISSNSSTRQSPGRNRDLEQRGPCRAFRVHVNQA